VTNKWDLFLGLVPQPSHSGAKKGWIIFFVFHTRLVAVYEDSIQPIFSFAVG
jgi:hypothetical protein